MGSEKFSNVVTEYLSDQNLHKIKKMRIAIFGLVIFGVISLIAIGILTWVNLDKDLSVNNLKESLKTAHLEGWHDNPIFVSNNASVEYHLQKNIYYQNQNMTLSVADGKVVECIATSVNNPNPHECSIKGLEGDISSLIEITNGDFYASASSDLNNDPSSRSLAFVMTNGKVFYVPVAQAFLNDDWSIRGSLALERPVTYIAEVEMTADSSLSGARGYLAVFDDGTYVQITREIMRI